MDYNLRVLEYLMNKLKLPWAPRLGHVDRETLSRSDEKTILSPYYQHFEDRLGFVSGLSVLDLLMQCGPNESKSYLLNPTRLA
jgi:hypothetical protein